MTVVNSTILLTGSSGQVGGELQELLRPLGAVVAPRHAELDLSDPASIRDLVRRVQPRWIVNAAAYTAVDKAETDAAMAYLVNRDAPRILGEEAVRLGAAVIHFSTDYVFSGDGEIPWQEDDPTGPLNVYGASKLAGEQALLATAAPHLLFRTSWVYGAHRNNFLRTILKLGRERGELRIVADQHGAPTWSRNLARLVAHSISHFEAHAANSRSSLAEAVSSHWGVYHACDQGETTWFGFAEEILRQAQLASPETHFAELRPVTTAEYPTVARRPKNSRLNCGKLSRALAFSMPPWQQSTAAVLGELFGPVRSDAEPATTHTA